MFLQQGEGPFNVTSRVKWKETPIHNITYLGIAFKLHVMLQTVLFFFFFKEDLFVFFNKNNTIFGEI